VVVDVDEPHASVEVVGIRCVVATVRAFLGAFHAALE
jgi:hypothetical protein